MPIKYDCRWDIELYLPWLWVSQLALDVSTSNQQQIESFIDGRLHSFLQLAI